MKEKLIVIRNFLYRLFAICIVVNLSTQISLLFLTSTNTITISQHLGVPFFFLAQMLTTAVVTTRIIIVYGLLFPAIALHWTIARESLFNETKDSQ